jgi:hypothetical protein
MPSNSIQLDDNGKLRHFLSIEGLNQTILNEILQDGRQPVFRGKHTHTINVRARRTTSLGRHSESERQHFGNGQR